MLDERSSPALAPGRPVHGDIWLTTKAKKILFLDPALSAHAIIGFAKLNDHDYDHVGNPNDYDEWGDPVPSTPLVIPTINTLLRRIADEKKLMEYAVDWA